MELSPQHALSGGRRSESRAGGLGSARVHERWGSDPDGLVTSAVRGLMMRGLDHRIDMRGDGDMDGRAEGIHREIDEFQTVD